MNMILKYLSKLLVAPLVFMLSLAGYSVAPQQIVEQKVPIAPSAPLFGDFNPTGGGSYRLQSSVTGTATSLTLASFKEPVSNIPYTMTYLNSTIEYATIEPQNNTTKEFVSFTGIAQNGDGTATITGLTRGLAFSYPYTASTTLQQSHPGQSLFILSNPPQLTNQYANKNNSDSISGLWSFATPPLLNSSATNTLQAASIAYVNGVAINGAGTSTENAMGIVQLPTNAQVASGVASSTTGAPFALPVRLATSSPVGSGGYVPVTGSTGKISPYQIATSSVDVPFGYSFTASTTFMGTTTIAANSTTTAPLILNGIKYSFNPTGGATSTVPKNDGNNKITWLNPDWQLLDDVDLSNLYAATTTTFTARQNLRVILNMQGMNAAGEPTMSFNGDFTGTNYITRQFQKGNDNLFTGTNGVNSTDVGMVMGSPQGTTTPMFVTYDITNVAAQRKLVMFQGSGFGSVSTEPPVNYSGSSQWNNTSNAITQITFSAYPITGALKTFTSGSRFRVYGSPN